MILIKSDTDGHDAEALMSCGEKLSYYSPVLYWENEIDTEGEYESYIQLCNYLRDNDYSDYLIFDNFGNFLVEGNSDTLRQIDNYIQRIRSSVSARTFYYVDVLACKDDKKAICQKYLAQYLKGFDK